MGADTFFVTWKAENPQRAFIEAVQQAQYDHGHAGYTGTLAEKDDFTMIPLPEGWEAHQYANKLIDESDPRVDDKWGPAGCIEIAKETYLFFGWASC
jgi:hypothetical protein